MAAEPDAKIAMEKGPMRQKWQFDIVTAAQIGIGNCGERSAFVFLAPKSVHPMWLEGFRLHLESLLRITAFDTC
jgi:hypothetical protein